MYNFKKHILLFHISFNFYQFIIDAEVYRLELNLKEIRLYIVNQHRNYSISWKSFYDAYSLEQLDKRTKRLLPELATLIPSVKSVNIIDQKMKFKLDISKTPTFPPTLFTYQAIFHDHMNYNKKLRKNISFPKFSVRKDVVKKTNNILDEWLRHSGTIGFITITLRESKFDPNRNSNFKALSDFSKYLKAQNIKILPLPDVENRLTTLETDAPLTLIDNAINNIHVRNYLYQRSLLNIFGSNGPTTLCVYSTEIPYIVMNFFPDDSEVRQSDREANAWFDLNPYIEPSIYRTFWSNSDKQYLVNGKETIDNLKIHFERIISSNYKK